MQRSLLTSLLAVFGAVLLSGNCAHAEGLVRSKSHFYYRTNTGKVSSAPVVRNYRGRIAYYRVTHPDASVDPRLDARLRRAASIAEERAHAKTQARCWRYVKQALVASGVISSYPSSNYACNAGDELVQKYGFKRLPVRDPYAAPVGAVIVYGKGAGGAGHVELRTKDGFVSDYRSKDRCFYPMLAVYGKFSS